MGSLRAGVREVREGVETLEAGVTELSMRAGDLQQRVCGLEAAIEETMGAYEANLWRILAVFEHTIERNLFTRLRAE